MNHLKHPGSKIERSITLLLLSGLLSLTSLAKRPNILFIAIDDQNDWIGCMNGHPDSITPHIDALAKSGTLFTNAHCQSPLCNPSRASLMLGLRPDHTGIYGLSPWFRNVEKYKNHVPLQKHLAAHGYHTASAGKIYHGGYGRKKSDSEWHELGPGATGAPFPKQRLVKDTPQPHKLVDWGVFPHKDEDKGDHKIASWTVDFLKRQAGEKQTKPFFCATGFFLPHVPCFTTQKWYDMHKNSRLPKIHPTDRDDTPRFSWYLHWKLPEVRLQFLQEKNEWHNLTRSYLACTTFVDHQIGRIMTTLKETGLDKNTIIILWSDHGWHIGEKQITGKNTLWDDSTRVPLIFAGPGIKPDQIVKEPAELLDIYPTLVDLLDLKKPAHKLQGHTLIPQLNNPETERKHPAITTHGAHNHGVRTRDWRYIRYADGSEELYYHPDDPHEWRNLLAKNPIAPAHRTHADRLAKHLPTDNVPPAPGSKARILTHNKKTGETIWEGKPIGKNDPIPEIKN